LNVEEGFMSSARYPDSEIEAQNIKFKEGGLEVGGYLAHARTTMALPGLLLTHEWFGLNDHIKDVARRYAREGFVVLAVDLYDGRLAKGQEEAAKFMAELKPEDGLKRIQAAFTHLSAQTFVKGNRVGITGFCMGGSFALLAACHISEMKATAPFYGDIPDPDDPLKNIRCPLLFVGAEKDQWITVAKTDRLKAAIKKYGLNGEIFIYPNAQHAFFNNTRPEVFNVDAAADAWQRVTEFLHKNLD
jgi:carboxymethylenebutenolidase